MSTTTNEVYTAAESARRVAQETGKILKHIAPPSLDMGFEHAQG